MNIPVDWIRCISHAALFDKPTRILTGAMEETHGPEILTVNLWHLYEFESEGRQKHINMSELKRILGGCNDRVLAFEGMFFAYLDTPVKRAKQLVDVVALSDSSKTALLTVKPNLQEKFGQADYSCYCVRLGDFVHMCSCIEGNTKGLPADFDYFLCLIKNGYQCMVTWEDVAHAIATLGMPALIMLNDITAIRYKLDAESIMTASSE